MPEREEPSVIRRLNFSTYLKNMPDRVKESEMTTRTPYAFVAELDSQEVVEFHAKIDRVVPREMGRAGVLLALFDPEAGNQVFATYDVDSVNGFLYPYDEPPRINHTRRLGHIGYLSGGYLLNSPAVFVPLSEAEAETEATSHDARPLNDSWTRALSLEGVTVGNN